MGRIQADTGLYSGINFTDTITKLLAIDAKPRDALTAKNTSLTSQQTELTQLSALLLSVQYIAKNLGKDATFKTQSVTSSNPAALAATVTGNPTAGNYQYVPLQTAQSQQFLAAGVQSATSPLGTGKLTFRFGPGVDRSADLADINGGQGFTRGKIQITDRNGATATIDLSTARTIDDVLQAINSSGAVNVTATTDNGKIKLIDNSGRTASHLRVQEVAGGATAASLGLSGIDAASNTAEGSNILSLYSGMSLNALNDGAGVRTNTVLPDISYTLHDGTKGVVDLSPIQLGSSPSQKETTLNQIMQEVNTQTGGKLQLSISADGQRLVATDTTSGTADAPGTFKLSAANNSMALHDLGLDTAASGNTINGNNVLGGLKTVLLSDLNGGSGLGTLGTLQLTDRSGTTAAVDVSGAETLNDVINKINSQAGAAGLGITASINQAGNGIQLTDTTGATTASLSAANSGDGTTSADKLGLTASVAASAIQGKSLGLRVVSENTTLASLNGGAGVAAGTIKFTSTGGNISTVDLSSSSIQTVGDVINAINRTAGGIHAQINATGDGIEIDDTAHGSQTLSISEGNSTTAHDLRLLNQASTVTRNGVSRQIIDGTNTVTISLGATDTLTDLQNKINAVGGGLSASILTDGSNRPYRLMLNGTQTGRAGNLIVDSSQLSGVSLQQTARGQDAVMALGGSAGAGSVLVSSSSNTFTSVLAGASLQLKGATGQAVTVSVAGTDSGIATNLQTFVTNYNNFRAELTKATAYDTTTNTQAVLSGDSTALQLETQLNDLVSGTFAGTGSIRSMAQMGISVNQDGSLTFDQTVLDSAYASAPAAVKQFFTTATNGMSDRFNTLINQFAGDTNSLLSSRINAIKAQVDDNNAEIKSMNDRLSTESDRLYTSFYNMEVAIGKFKNSQTVLNSLSILDPYTGASTTSSSSSG